MSQTGPDLSQLLNSLRPDAFRSSKGFSPEMGDLVQRLPSLPDPEVKTLCQDWLARHQPCLFGRVAAKSDLIEFCVLREQDLLGSEIALRDQIQAARLRFTAGALAGRRSAFVLLVLSERLALAEPGPEVLAIATRVCEYYLLTEIQPDSIYHEIVHFEMPSLGDSPSQIVWFKAGVNYFSAQADRRWWHDHRVPAGLAFSVNSVGHMVKTAGFRSSWNELAREMGLSEAAVGPFRSLDKAQVVALQTIERAANTLSGRATNLVERSPGEPECPHASLRGYSPLRYRGWYHTDHTLPTSYFEPSVARPQDIDEHDLTFDYLTDDAVENLDHRTMGVGVRIRSERPSDPLSAERWLTSNFEGEVLDQKAASELRAHFSRALGSSDQAQNR